MRGLATLTLVLASGRALAQTLTLPISQKDPQGLLTATLSLGTPPQQISLHVDSASQWTCVPDATVVGGAGFRVKNSSSAEVGQVDEVAKFPDGSSIAGPLLQDTVLFTGLGTLRAHVLLAQNSTSRPQADLGVLGLCLHNPNQVWSPFAQRERRPPPASVWEHIWDQHPTMRRTLTLELGGSDPRLVVGATPGPDVRFLSTLFTAMSPEWLVSVRALGLSQGGGSPWLRWNLDFNAYSLYGAPAILDSGSPTIRFGSAVYAAFLRGMPGDCRSTRSTGVLPLAGQLGETACSCEPDRLGEDFPSISVSLEAGETFRVLGLDSGADVIVCIPPEAYVTYDPTLKRCRVAVSDAGPHHTRFGFETVVLGLPFFRGANVVLDAVGRRVGLTPAEVWSPNYEGVAPGMGGIGGQVTSFMCADPKNWWSTGKRLSLRRVLVVTVGVALLTAAIFSLYSPSPAAVRLRGLAEGIAHDCGQRRAGDGQLVDEANSATALNGGGQGNYARRRGAAAAAAELRVAEDTPDRPFVQMVDRTNPA